ncbi:MAG: hypothetical protein N2999_00910 [Proteobacteria bacterium]|nr:hypothetical protein [Pseudomonadota bacterium]
MNRLFLILFLILPLSVYGQERDKRIQTIKERISKFKVSDIKETTAIAGVRGAEDEKGEELFWYGKDSVKKDELETFRSLIDKLEKGEKEEVRKEVETFLIKYPNSALAKDALELLNILKTP